MRLKLRSVAGISVFSFIAVVSVASAAFADSADISCGAVLTVDTTLHHDVTNCPNDGLVVGSDHITVNLNGHTVSAAGPKDPSDDDIGISVVGRHDVTVRNGVVRGFNRGVLVGESRRVTLASVHVVHNRFIEIFLRSSNHSRVIDSEASFTEDPMEGPGLFLFQSSDNLIAGNRLSHDGEVLTVSTDSNRNLVTNNRIDHGGFLGIAVNFSTDNVVSHNHVSDTGGEISTESADRNRITDNLVDRVLDCDGCGIGIQIYGNDNVVARNRVEGGSRYGIEVEDFQDPGHSPASGNVIMANWVRGAGEGIALGPETGGVVLKTLVAGNRVSHSIDDGIQVVGPSTGLTTTTIRDNFSRQNGNLGINAIAGVIDGGGNRASGNGNPLQCVNVSCH